MCPSSSHRARGSAGFTLVEALAALAITMIAVAAIGQLANGGVRAGLSAERRMTEAETARKIIAGLPARAALADGTLTGSLDGHAWRLQAQPFPNDLAAKGGASAYEPQRITLRVAAPGGGQMEIDMIRLRRRAGP